MSVLKRQREARKAEKAAIKRERRELRKTEGPQEVTAEDMDAYLGGAIDEVEDSASADAEPESPSQS